MGAISQGLRWLTSHPPRGFGIARTDEEMMQPSMNFCHAVVTDSSTCMCPQKLFISKSGATNAAGNHEALEDTAGAQQIWRTSCCHAFVAFLHNVAGRQLGNSSAVAVTARLV